MKKSLSKSESVKKEEKGQELQARQSSFKTKVLVCILMYLLAVCILYFSYAQYSHLKNYLLFSDARIKKQQNKLQLLIEIFFCFALIVLTHWVFIFVITTFNQKKDDKFTHVLHRSIRNCLQHFIIFIGIYAYLLVCKQSQFKKKEFVLLANWFIYSRIFNAILWVLDVKTGFSLRELGSSLGIFTILIMLLHINGYNVFDHF